MRTVYQVENLVAGWDDIVLYQDEVRIPKPLQQVSLANVSDFIGKPITLQTSNDPNQEQYDVIFT